MKCCSVNIGKLNKIAMVQRAVHVDDGYGGTTRQWQDHIRIRCSIDQMKGFERYAAMKTEHIETHRLITRFNESIMPDMRILYPIDLNPTSERLVWGENIYLPVEPPQVISYAYAITGIVDQDGEFMALSLEYGGAV